MNRISRLGAYGILVHDSKILLTRKKAGPYKGLWDLPGGAIEFSETPEEALKRELLEESALAISQFEFSSVSTATDKYDNNGVPYEFHHTGLIYKVLSWSGRPDLIPEEENDWVILTSLKIEELTPFAKHAVASLPKNKEWRPQNSIRGKGIAISSFLFFFPFSPPSVAHT